MRTLIVAERRVVSEEEALCGTTADNLGDEAEVLRTTVYKII